MILEIEISAQADIDLRNIYEYIKREYSIWACMNTVQISMNQVHLTNDTLVPLMRVFEFNDSKALIYVC